MKQTEGGAYRCDSERRPWALGHMVVKGGGGEGGVRGWSSPFLLVVAVLQVFTLNVPAAVVRAGELVAVLVHAPADAPFASTGRLALRARQQFQAW